MCACCGNVSPDKDTEKQKILGELSTIYHTTIEPLESLYQYNILGVDSFTGTYQYFFANYMIYGIYSLRQCVMVSL